VNPWSAVHSFGWVQIIASNDDSCSIQQAAPSSLGGDLQFLRNPWCSSERHIIIIRTCECSRMVVLYLQKRGEGTAKKCYDKNSFSKIE
jgi:hypothetical protein